MKTNDEMMAELLTEAERYLDHLIDAGGKAGLASVQNEMRKYIYMVEAFQADQNLLLAKLAYNDDLADVGGDALIQRFTKANLFAGEWMLARNAA